MKIYRHYKKKLYKLHGLAKHSETLEDLVLYDCLYENDLGKTWVRPRELFEGKTVVDGQEVERFKELSLEIEEHTQIDDALIARLAPLMKSCLGNWDETAFRSNLENHTRFHLLLAVVEGKTSGFKLGYEEDSECFYSWVGGVDPEARGWGLATALIEAQHQWCKNNGYQRIKTKTLNRYKEMLLLNIKSGFEITGTYKTEQDEVKILLQKSLRPI